MHPPHSKENHESLWDGIPFIKKAAEHANENEPARDAAHIWKKKVKASRKSRKYNRIGKVVFPIVLSIGTILYFVYSLLDN